MTLESRVGAPQFFTLSSLLEQTRLAAQHSLRFHESTHWVAGVIHLTPGQHDTQTGHDRDELYLVLRGEAVFRIGADRHPVAPGDFWFVPAGVEHRFEDFHHELVVFYVLVEP
jgi:mannose-6-phosphate isomerase-like protein (cupin superfamily)